MRFGFGIRLEPFLQAAVRPGLIWGQAGALLRQIAAEVVVHPEEFGGACRVAEEFAQLLHVNRRPHAHLGRASVGELEGVLRRIRGPSHEPMVLRLLQMLSR